MSASYHNSKLRFVPPAGRYSTPFFFAAYYTGGGASSAQDHGPMLFSPLSSGPSGYYESGGGTNANHPSDAIGNDCKLLLSVAELRTGESIVTAQEAPLGRKMELPPGRYRVVGQMLSFGGHAFASNEALYDVVAPSDDNVGLATSTLFDTLRNVQNHGGLPSAAGSPPQTRRGGSSTSGSPLVGGNSTFLGSTATSPQRSATQDHIAATVRQSEEALSHAVAHFGAAAADAQSRLSRQSSIDSRGTAANTTTATTGLKQRPPLGYRDGPLGNGKGQQPSGTTGGLVTSDAEEHDDAADAMHTHVDAGFALPPPSVLHVGAPLLFAMRVHEGGGREDPPPYRGAHHSGRIACPYHILMQQEEGPRHVPQASASCVAPSFFCADATRIEGLPLVARGVTFHWIMGGGGRVGLTATKCGSLLSVQPTKHNELSDNGTYTAVARSAEAIGFTGREGVLSGVQLSLAAQRNVGAAHMPHSFGLLISIRPSGAGHDAPIVEYLPYLEIAPMAQQMEGDGYRPAAQSGFDMHPDDVLGPSRLFRLQWKVSARAVDESRWRNDGADAGGDDVVLFERSVTEFDVLAMHFERQDPAVAPVRNAQRGASEPSVVDAVLRINHEAVCRTAIPLGPLEAFQAQQALGATPLHVIVIARGVEPLGPQHHSSDHRRVGSAHRALPLTSLPLCRNVTALSHYPSTVDVISVPPTALHAQWFGDMPAADDAARPLTAPQRHMYVWRRGESLATAAHTTVLLYRDRTPPLH